MLTWVYVHVWYTQLNTGQTQYPSTTLYTNNGTILIQKNPAIIKVKQKFGQHELPSGLASPAPFMAPILSQRFQYHIGNMSQGTHIYPSNNMRLVLTTKEYGPGQHAMIMNGGSLMSKAPKKIREPKCCHRWIL